MAQEDSCHSIDALLQQRSAELSTSLQAVATCAGVGRAHLYKILQGQVRDPSVRTLCRIYLADGGQRRTILFSASVLLDVFYEKVGGTYIDEKIEKMGDIDIMEVSYGWKNIE